MKNPQSDISLIFLLTVSLLTSITRLTAQTPGLAYIPVSVVRQSNSPLRGSFWYFKCEIPVPLGNISLGGIPFTIPEDQAGTVPNFWFANLDASGNLEIGPNSITININRSDVKEVFTLLNTGWGRSDALYSQILFHFASGETFTKSLIGDVDLRDWAFDPSDFPVGTQQLSQMT